MKQNGTVTANYIRTMNIDEPLARFTPNSSRFYKQDALGSVIALTDENGIIRTTYSYDPFGAGTMTGEASDNPIQYTGRENDNTGLYYYRARYYSPELQRFISEDPIGFAAGDVNFYAYVGNSPVNKIDPLGLYTFPGGELYVKCMENAPMDCKQKYDDCIKSCKSDQCTYERSKDRFNRHCEMVCTDEYIGCTAARTAVSFYCKFRYVPNLGPRPTK